MSPLQGAILRTPHVAAIAFYQRFGFVDGFSDPLHLYIRTKDLKNLIAWEHHSKDYPNMIIVTGGSGKVGRAVVSDLMAHGYKVASIDSAADERHLQSAEAHGHHLHARRHHGFRAGDGGLLRHQLARGRAGDGRGASGRHPHARRSSGPRDLRYQRAVDLQRLRGGEAAQDPQRRLGVERDGLWHSLCADAGLRSRGRGDRAAGILLFALEARRREDGRAICPVGRRDQDHRAALFQRAGAGRLPPLRAYNQDPRSRRFNLWTYIDARDARRPCACRSKAS